MLAESDDNSRRAVVNGVVYYKNLTKADSQVLQCNASNKHGYIFKNVYLNVLGKWVTGCLFYLSENPQSQIS